MIQKIINPNISQWQALCERPALPQLDVQQLVQQIFIEIKRNGDEAVKKYTGFFDDVVIENVKVSAEAIAAAAQQIPNDLKQAIQQAKNNIEKFHASQQEDRKIIETTPGVECWRESRPIGRVGIYIPGGSAPLFSTVLMLGIPAKIAGCKEIVLCTPPDKNGNINPVILYTAQLVGITSVYAIGGIRRSSRSWFRHWYAQKYKNTYPLATHLRYRFAHATHWYNCFCDTPLYHNG